MSAATVTSKMKEYGGNGHGAGMNASQSVSLRGWLAVIGSAIGAFMAVLDIQITNSSLKDIQGALGASLDEGSWISTAYLIAEIVTIPLTGWLSKVFGVKRYVLVNAVLFLIFSMLCGISWDLNSMIAFRALQGFTGGTLIPMSFSIILSTLPKSKQPIGLAIFSITAVFAPSIGPAIGGYLTDTFCWQYIFYLNLVPGVLLIALLWYALDAGKANFSLLKTGDYAGIVTMAIGLSCLEYVLEEGQRKDWFGSELIVRSAVVAVVMLTAFIIIEFKVKHPLVNLRLFGRRNFGIGSLSNVALGIALYGSVYLLPIYLSIVQGYSASQIGTVLIWSGLPQLVITPMVPMIMKRVDSRVLLAFGLLTFGASALLNGFMSHDYAGEQLIASMIVRAVGQPFIMVPLSTVATQGIEMAEIGSASALFNMMRNLGGSIGIATLSTVLTQREQFHSVRIGERVTNFDLPVRDFLTQASSHLHASGLTSFNAHEKAVGLLDQMVRHESYVMSFNDCFVVIAVILAVASITAVLLKKSGQSAHAME